MSRGRPPKGAELVESLESSAQAKERLKVILQTIAGEITVVEACARLNIGEARFHELRTETLQAAAAHLEPKPAGRPPQQADDKADEVSALREQILELKIELRATQIREELALLMPGVLKPAKHSDDRRKRLEALEEDAKKKSPRHQRLDALQDGTNSTPKNSNRYGKPST